MVLYARFVSLVAALEAELADGAEDDGDGGDGRTRRTPSGETWIESLSNRSNHTRKKLPNSSLEYSDRAKVRVV